MSETLHILAVIALTPPVFGVMAMFWGHNPKNESLVGFMLTWPFLVPILLVMIPVWIARWASNR